MSLKLFIDSGAFSVWASGGSVDLKAYGRALNGWYEELPKGTIEVAANLDVMPGRFGVPPSAAQVEESAVASAKNYARLKERVNPAIPLIPVFHRGERLYWLEKMLGEGATYIGLGAIAKVPMKQKTAWLDQVFGFLIGKGSYPAIKLHGFGVNALGIRVRYPWHSIDSWTWMQSAAMGRVYTPGLDGYRSAFNFGASTRSASKGNNTTYWGLSSKVREHIDAYLDEVHSGLTITELSRSKPLRALVNVHFTKQLDQAFPAPAFKTRQRIGADVSEVVRGLSTPLSPRARTYFVSGVFSNKEDANTWPLNIALAERRLIPFSLLAKGGSLKRYVDKCSKLMKPGRWDAAPVEKERKRKVHAFTNRPAE